jgi:hypothetical protein
MGAPGTAPLADSADLADSTASALASPATSVPAGRRWGADPVLAHAAHWRELLAGLGRVIGPRGTRALVQHSLALCLEQGPEVGTEVGTVLRLLTQSHPSDEVLAWWLAVVDGEARTFLPVLRGKALQLLGPECCDSLSGLAGWPLSCRALAPRGVPGLPWPTVAAVHAQARP